MSYPPPRGYPPSGGYQGNYSSDMSNAAPYNPQASYQSGSYQGYPPNEQTSNQGYQASNYQGYPPPHAQDSLYQASNHQGYPPAYAQGSYQGYPPNAQQASSYGQGLYPAPSRTAGGAAPVVGPQYCLPHPASFAVVKHVLSLSEGDWTINDAAGNTVFKVSGRAVSIRDRRYLLDAAGNKLLRMQKKILTLHDTWYVYHGDSEHLICTVKKSALVQLKPSMDIFLASNTTESVPDYKLAGNFLERDMMVYFGQQPIAQMTREITLVNMAVGKDTFGVTVFPGGDYAFVFALVVIMDAVYLHRDGDSDW
jgi:uncharacterized protein YxjI